MRSLIANALQLIGGCTISVGAFILAPWLGAVVLGVIIILIGLVVEIGGVSGSRPSPSAPAER